MVAPYSDDADVRYLMDNGIFVFDNRSVNLFGGSRAAAQRYAGVINSYLDEVDPSVQIYNLVAPCSSEFYLPARYRANSGDQWENIKTIYSALDERVKSVDAYNALAATPTNTFISAPITIGPHWGHITPIRPFASRPG